MTNHTNLIERLRKPLGNFRIDGRLVTIQECIEAADALEANDQAISTLTAEVEELREAGRRFFGALMRDDPRGVAWRVADAESGLRATLTKGEGDKLP